MPDPAAGIALAKDLGIPVFDTNLTGYPQRMRTGTPGSVAIAIAAGRRK